MENKRTFQDLLKDMPLVANDVMTLTGVVARSSEPDQFLLITEDGGRVSLPVTAVIDYRHVGGSIGQEIVQVQLKTDQIPAEAMKTVAQAGAFHGSKPFVLATPHHVSRETLATMQAMSGSSAYLVRTNFGDDKTPGEDGTYPTGNGRWHSDQ